MINEKKAFVFFKNGKKMKKKKTNLLSIISVVKYGLFLCLLSCSSVKNAGQQKIATPTYQIASYNYGGLEKLSPTNQINLLEKFGYNQIVLKSETIDDFNNIDEFIRLVAEGGRIKINAIFERYNFNDPPERKERWKKVVDKISFKNIQLWIIIGKKIPGIADSVIINKLIEISIYAKQKKVEVILYPHSDCYIASAEEALVFVEKINQPNLKLALHLYHEIRAGNGARISAVFENVKHRLGAVTLAGTDMVADYTNSKTRDTSTIKPIGSGNFDLADFIVPLMKSKYKGTVAFMNFGITENPLIYLPRSLMEWNNKFSTIK